MLLTLKDIKRIYGIRHDKTAMSRVQEIKTALHLTKRKITIYDVARYEEIPVKEVLNLLL